MAYLVSTPWICRLPLQAWGHPCICPFGTPAAEYHWGLGESQGQSSTGLPGEPLRLLLTGHVCHDFVILPSTSMKRHSNIEFFIQLILKPP